jgi:hypothetical protein
MAALARFSSYLRCSTPQFKGFVGTRLGPNLRDSGSPDSHLALASLPPAD